MNLMIYREWKWFRNHMFLRLLWPFFLRDFYYGFYTTYSSPVTFASTVSNYQMAQEFPGILCHARRFDADLVTKWFITFYYFYNLYD